MGHTPPHYLAALMHDQRVRTVIRYGIVGISISAIYAAIFYLALSMLPGHRLLSNTIAYGLAVAIQYGLHSTFTFRVESHGAAQVTRFLVTTLIGYLFSVVITVIAVPYGLISDLIGTLIIVLGTPILNFVMLSLWVFARRLSNDHPETSI